MVSKRQGPLLHTHRALKSKVLAKRSTLADDWSSLPVLVRHIHDISSIRTVLLPLSLFVALHTLNLSISSL